jgi:hypothetical protein
MQYVISCTLGVLLFLFGWYARGRAEARDRDRRFFSESTWWKGER